MDGQLPSPPPRNSQERKGLIQRVGGKSQRTRYATKRTQNTTWKPASLRIPFLLFLAGLSFLLLGALAILSAISNRRKGLVQVDDQASITSSQFFAYNYVPVIVAVLYSLLWQLVDSDARRYEPFPDLSRPGGVRGDELFYEYTYEPSFKVPFKAAKKRHWGVAVGAFAYILASVILGSLSSAIMGVKTLTVSDTDPVNVWKAPSIAKSAQGNVLNGEFITQASSILLQQAELPSFATSRYSISPFASQSNNKSPPTSQNERNGTLTADTEATWAELSCYVPPNSTNTTQSTLDGHTTIETAIGMLNGDTAYMDEIVLDPSTPFYGKHCFLTWGAEFELSEDDQPQDSIHFAEEWADFAANSGPCPTNWHQAFLMRAVPLANVSQPEKAPANTGSDSDPRARFKVDLQSYLCWATYYTGLTSVQVRTSDWRVISLDEKRLLANKKPMDNSTFDISTFETTLGEREQAACGSDSKSTSSNNTTPWESRFDISTATSVGNVALNLVPNHVAFFENSSESYASRLDQVFGQTFVLAHRAVSTWNNAQPNGTSTGTKTRIVAAVVIIPAFTIAAMTVLGMLGTCALALAAIYFYRDSVLVQDPDSISAMLSLIADHSEGPHRFGPLADASQHHTSKDLSMLATKSKYRLRTQSAPGSNDLCIFESCSQSLLNTETQCDVVESEENKSTSVGVDPMPFFLSNIGFVSTVASLVLLEVALIVLYVVGRDRDGFSYLASSDFKAQLLWSFVPTLIASLIGISWASLHRDLCAFEPLVRVARGQSRARESLSLNYASRPPIVTCFPALLRRHLIVAIVAILAVSTSVLQISMAALFSTAPANAQHTVSVSQTFASRVLSVSSSNLPGSYHLTDSLNFVRTNISDGTDLPAWTTDQYSFIPIALSTGDNDTEAQYWSQTIGVGAALDCAPYSGVKDSLDYGNTRSGTSIAATFNITSTFMANGTEQNDKCVFSDFVATPVNSTDVQSLRCISSWVDAYKTNASLVDECAGRSIIMAETGGPINYFNSPKTNLTAIVCTPSVFARNFSIRFNSKGQIFETKELNGGQDLDIFQNGTDALTKAFTYTYGNTAGDSTDVSDEDCGNARFDWVGLLTARYRDIIAPSLDEKKTVNALSDATSAVFGRTFAVFMSQHRDDMFAPQESNASSSSSVPISATKLFPQQRQKPSEVMFIISFILLSLYILALIMILFQRRVSPTPRLVTSFGAVIAYSHASRMLEDFRGTYSMGTKQRDAKLERLGRRYGFGWFVGVDGELKQGIEREPLLRN